MRKDTTTQGNWIGTYGADGDYINALTAQPPSYGTVTFTGTSNFTWASSTTDVQALEDQPPGTSRIASTWYSGGTETFSVVTTDGNEHTIALYLLDWDGGRAETVTAETPTGTVLSSAEAFSNFTGGQYAVYTICGSVNFVVTLTAGANAVVSGVFFGGAPGAATTTSSLVDTGGGLSQVVGETNASNALTALYVRAGDELLSVIRPNGTGWTQHFIHKDGLGSVRTITDDNGNIVDTRGYEAFGTKNSEAGSEPLAYGFAGEAFDSTTHLAYHRAQVDGFEGGEVYGDGCRAFRSERSTESERYSYVTNDPADRFDPTGNDDVAEQMNFFNFVGIQIPSGKCAVSSFDVKFTPLMSHPSISESLSSYPRNRGGLHADAVAAVLQWRLLDPAVRARKLVPERHYRGQGCAARKWPELHSGHGVVGSRGQRRLERYYGNMGGSAWVRLGADRPDLPSQQGRDLRHAGR